MSESQMVEQAQHRQFLELFLPEQDLVMGFLVASIRNRTEAEDLFQEVSAVLWEKFDRYDESRPFRPWALGIARNYVFRWRRSAARNKLTFSTEILEKLAETTERCAHKIDARCSLLKECVGKLADKARRVLDLRYEKALSIAEIARKCDTTVGATEMAMVRIRRSLRDCVEKKLALEGQ